MEHVALSAVRGGMSREAEQETRNYQMLEVTERCEEQSAQQHVMKKCTMLYLLVSEMKNVKA